MSCANGDILRMASFTHVPSEGPLISLTIKVGDRKKVAVFMLLGEENKDGTEPLDLEKRLNDLGWFREPDADVSTPGESNG
jgi:hypothetical protein